MHTVNSWCSLCSGDSSTAQMASAADGYESVNVVTADGTEEIMHPCRPTALSIINLALK